MIRTRTLVVCGVLTGSLIASACGFENPDSLVERRSVPVGGGSDRAGDQSHEEEDVLDVTVPDTDDAQLGAGETADGNSLAPGESPPIVLFLNRNGATMASGSNDSRANTSNIVKGRTTFPPSRYANDATRWATIMSTVKSHFARYNVTVVDTEPKTGTYLEAVVTSGSPSLIGYGDTLGGIAPSRCGVIPTSVVFVFDRRLRDEVHTAEVISHELGHSLSLSHTQTQSDLMSYTRQTPLKFENVDARCGTRPGLTEPCNCPATTQNNHMQLLMHVGAARSNPPPDEPANPSPEDEGKITIVSPTNGSTYTPNNPVFIKVDASKAGDPIHSIALRWIVNQSTYDMPWRRGIVESGIYTWSITTGEGNRRFYAHAVTTTGKVIDSEVVRISSTAQ